MIVAVPVYVRPRAGDLTKFRRAESPGEVYVLRQRIFPLWPRGPVNRGKSVADGSGTDFCFVSIQSEVKKSNRGANSQLSS